MDTTPTPDLGQEPVFFELDEDAAWMDNGLCAQTDPEAFFPEKGGSTRAAKAICASCPVRQQCLDYALTHRENSGIWGGLSAHERRDLLKNDPTQPSPHTQNGTAA